MDVRWRRSGSGSSDVSNLTGEKRGESISRERGGAADFTIAAQHCVDRPPHATRRLTLLSEPVQPVHLLLLSLETEPLSRGLDPAQTVIRSPCPPVAFFKAAALATDRAAVGIEPRGQVPDAPTNEPQRREPVSNGPQSVVVYVEHTFN